MKFLLPLIAAIALSACAATFPGTGTSTWSQPSQDRSQNGGPMGASTGGP